MTFTAKRAIALLFLLACTPAKRIPVEIPLPENAVARVSIPTPEPDDMTYLMRLVRYLGTEKPTDRDGNLYFEHMMFLARVSPHGILAYRVTEVKEFRVYMANSVTVVIERPEGPLTLVLGPYDFVAVDLPFTYYVNIPQARAVMFNMRENELINAYNFKGRVELWNEYPR